MPTERQRVAVPSFANSNFDSKRETFLPSDLTRDQFLLSPLFSARNPDGRLKSSRVQFAPNIRFSTRVRERERETIVFLSERIRRRRRMTANILARQKQQQQQLELNVNEPHNGC